MEEGEDDGRSERNPADDFVAEWQAQFGLQRRHAGPGDENREENDTNLQSHNQSREVGRAGGGFARSRARRDLMFEVEVDGTGEKHQNPTAGDEVAVFNLDGVEKRESTQGEAACCPSKQGSGIILDEFGTVQGRPESCQHVADTEYYAVEI